MRIGQLKNLLVEAAKENPNAIVNVIQINKKTKASGYAREIIDVKKTLFGSSFRDQVYINIICEKE